MGVIGPRNFTGHPCISWVESINILPEKRKIPERANFEIVNFTSKSIALSPFTISNANPW